MLIATPYFRAKGAKAQTFLVSAAAGLLITLASSLNAAASSLPPGAGASIVLKSFDGPSVPLSKNGNEYPLYAFGEFRGEPFGGIFTSSIDTSAKVVGAGSLKMVLTSGPELYVQFNPYNVVGREFAHTYAENPSAWMWNTYNRWSFWIKTPAQMDRPYGKDGLWNSNVGTYHKTVSNPDYYSDEGGGGHAYYNQNWPLTGTWVNCTMNFYVDHWRGGDANAEDGSAERITDEPNYNLFDSLTRFYFQTDDTPSSRPAEYHIDDITFYRQTNSEPEQQVRSVCSTFVPNENRIIVTWMRNKAEPDVNHEVRYSFSNIHQNGWSSATPAPNGVAYSNGTNGYNGMHYDTTALPLSGKSVVYLAIKPMANNPQNLFAQVAIPLGDNVGSSPPPSPLQPPRNLRIIQ